MPTTHFGVGINHYLPPVTLSGVVRDTVAEQHTSHLAVVTQSVVAHHHHVELDFLNVDPGDINFAHFIEDWISSAFLGAGFPFGHALAVANQVDLHVRI